MTTPLTPKEHRAIRLRVRGYTKREALKRAGYEDYDGHANRVWDRQRVKDELARRQEDVARKAEVDSVRLISLLMEIAELDVGDLVDEEGNMRPVAEMKEGVRKALAVSGFGKKAKISTNDRLKAIEMVAKLSGLMEDSLKLTADKELTDALIAGRKRAAIRNRGE
jgi:phage terminase small subunit